MAGDARGDGGAEPRDCAGVFAILLGWVGREVGVEVGWSIDQSVAYFLATLMSGDEEDYGPESEETVYFRVNTTGGFTLDPEQIVTTRWQEPGEVLEVTL